MRLSSDFLVSKFAFTCSLYLYIMTLAETEQKAADLAKFLGVPIEGL